MNRFIYWLRTRFDKDNCRCGHFCVTCKYFDLCEEDLSLVNIGKNKEIAEVCKNDELKNVS